MTRARGVSLLETVISTFLLGGVMLALFNIYPVSAQAINQAEQAIRADAISRDVVEQMRTMSWDNFKKEKFEKLWDGKKLPPPQTHQQVTYKVVKIEVEKFEMLDPSTGDKVDIKDDILRRVIVTVEWKHGGETKRTIRDILLHNI